VAGIITHYWTEAKPVTGEGLAAVPGAEVFLNSGIIIAEQITRATEAIEAGVPLRR
jgi:hypothetical protein